MSTLDEKLNLCRAKAAHARRRAFVDEPLSILGFPQKRVTLYTYNALVASLNAFMVPGAKPAMTEVAQFLWLHSPEFRPDDRKAMIRFFKRVQAKNLPPWRGVADWLRAHSPLAARKLGPTTLARLVHGAAAIREQIREATFDLPKGSSDGDPLPYALQAHLLSFVWRELRMPLSEAENMPLARLVQFIRAAMHHASGGKAMMMTEEEANVTANHLAEKTAASSTPEAMAAAQAEIKAIAARRMAELNTR